MEYTADTPRAERTVAGRKVQVIQPYTAGQPLTEATAAMLNQTFAENISNNLRDRIKDGLTEGEGDAATTREFTDTEVQTLVDQYTTEYEPGVRTGGGGAPRITDPVEREARKLARAKVTEHVKSKGLKTADVDMADLTNKVFEANREAFMKQGKAVVAAQQKASDGLDLGDLDVAAPAPAEAA